MPTFTRDGQVNFSVSDIRDAGADGIISPDDAERLINWLSSQPGEEADDDARPETAKGFNLVTVAYYFGAMLMISACAWFLGDKWDSLGSAGILATCIVYFAVAAGLGWWLRSRGYKVGGGLLITVAVCLTPLIVFCIEDLTGFWPGLRETDDPTKYKDFYPYIRSAWILMELATMAVALIALIRVRFGFLTAPLAFSLWFFSMDVAAWFLGNEHLDWNTEAWMAVLIGAVTMLAGYAFDRTLNRPEEKSEDFAFWCYLFGLMAFWGGLTSLDSDSETGKFIYFLVNIGLAAVSLYLHRSVFLVFGAIGIFAYIGHLAYAVFKDSVMFPFVMIVVGLGVIVATVLAQKYLRAATKTKIG
jgi:hypothetical protein